MSTNESFGRSNDRYRIASSADGAGVDELGDVEGHQLAGSGGTIGGENLRARAIEDDAGASSLRRPTDDDPDPMIPGMRRLSNHRG